MAAKRVTAALIGLFSALAIASGCTRANPSFCDEETPCRAGVCNLADNSCPPQGSCVPGTVESCEGGERIVCDEGGSLVSETCEFGCSSVADDCNECEPESAVCETSGAVDELTICSAEGLLEVQRDCLLGCAAEEVGCVDVDPSNGLATDLDFIDGAPEAVIDLVLEDGFDVRDDGRINDASGTAIAPVSSRVFDQGGGEMLRVYRVRSLTMSGTVRLLGTTPIAFVSDFDIAIDGELQVFAGRRTTGACVGEARQNDSNGDKGGGGGGGFGGTGAPGGDADNADGGGGGSTHGTAELVPLVAGCDGARVGGVMAGGVGGGGVQLVTRGAIRFGANGKIGAVGGGGGYEVVGVGTASGASGGGSGGGILLEAPLIELASGAFVSANGGGGGCAVTTGESGKLSGELASGANCSGAAGDGGNGASNDNNNADQGMDGSGTNATGGGGGGGPGRIRVNVPSGNAPSDSFFSPAPSSGTLRTR